MQAVAIGASVAYPLLRLARTIPLPVLMVGAGLFFAGSKTGQAAAQRASDMASDLSDEAMRRVRELQDQVGESASTAKTYASDQLDRVSAAVSGGTDNASRLADVASASVAANSRKLQDEATSLGSSLSGRATDLRDEGVRMANSAAASVQEVASGASSAVRNAVGTAADAGMDAARVVRDNASDLTDRAGKTFLQTVERNPLLVAGVGLLIGGLIASALPRTDIEDDLVGDASHAVKRRAQTAASQGFDKVRGAAGEVYDEAARQAEAEGLTPDGIGKAAQDVGERVRRVAERAVTTAFEPPEENQQPNIQGGNHHG